MKYKLAVIGSRTFNDYTLLENTLNRIKDDIEVIISGGASGADTLAEQYAEQYNIPTLIFPADWKNLKAKGAVIKVNKYGQRYNANAGFDRNKTIVDNSNALVAFWDGESNGSRDTIIYAKSKQIPVKIIKF